MKTTRRQFNLSAAGLFTAAKASALSKTVEDTGQPAAKSIHVRPTWVQEGVVWAQHMEPLSYLRRRGGGSVDYVEWRKQYFSEENLLKWKEAGFNLIFRTLQKGAGLKAEAEDIEDTRKYVEMAHRHGMKVGGYVGATLLCDSLFAEEPAAREWIRVDASGRPITYSPMQSYRLYGCRNNPGYLAWIRKILRLGVQDLKLDAIHWDQLCWAAEPKGCHCKHCAAQFREFLRRRYSAAQLNARFGFTVVDAVEPPYYPDQTSIPLREVVDPMVQNWAFFRVETLTQRWREFVEYIHELNPEVAVHGNPSQGPDANSGFLYGADPSRLYEYGDFLRSEEMNQPRWTSDGRLVSYIRTYKTARLMGKPVNLMHSTSGPEEYNLRELDASEPEYQGTKKQELEGSAPSWDSAPFEFRLAESLAYNKPNFLGTFNYLEELTPPVRRCIKFFHEHKAELRDTVLLSDVAVLRSFSAIQFDPRRALWSTMLFEQSLIQAKVPFALIYDRHLNELGRYKVLVLANHDALSSEQMETIRRYVANGGGLVATEHTSMRNEWHNHRDKFGLADLFGIETPPAGNQPNVPVHRQSGSGRVVYIPRIEAAVAPPPATMTYRVRHMYWKLPKNHSDLINAVRWAAGADLTADVQAPDWVTIEFVQDQAKHCLFLHLLNFKFTEPLAGIPVKISVPAAFRLRQAIIDTPDGAPPRTVAVTMQGQTALFRIPELKMYNLVKLQMEKQ